MVEKKTGWGVGWGGMTLPSELGSLAVSDSSHVVYASEINEVMRNQCLASYHDRYKGAINKKAPNGVTRELLKF